MKEEIKLDGGLKTETVRRGQISVPPAVGARAVADGASSVY